MKQWFRKMVPGFLISWYHLALAGVAAGWYGRPSEHMIVVGVTGTSGKSSVVSFLRQILEQAGMKVGALSTVEFCVAGRCVLNDRKMTMLGRMQTQKFLREMKDAGCSVAIVETTSQGFLQSRHRFINYDIMVLTNLYPEHLEAHGGFEQYKKAKLGIFGYGGESPPKLRLRRSFSRVKGKIAIVNGESEYAEEFLAFPFDKKIKFTAAEALPTSVLGKHTPMNVAAACTVARELGVEEIVLQQAVARLQSVPGRIEFIPEAEAHGFRVIVDYAFEPRAMEALYRVVDQLAPKRVIHVLGATGGGRDHARRPVLGRMAAEQAEIMIVTNEDPYEENPLEIMKEVARGAQECKIKNVKCKMVELLMILDRKETIGKALTLAQKGDVVLITGKGAEQAMCVAGGKKLPWDDRRIVRELLKTKKA